MNTLYHLLAEHESIHVPLARISEKYLNLSSPVAEWLDRLRDEMKRVHRGG